MISPIYVGKAGNVCHKYRENPGFQLRRPVGLPNDTFWHFLTPVTILTPEGLVDVKAGGCYLCPRNTPQYIYSKGTLYHDWMHLSPRATELWEKLGLSVNQVYYLEDSTFITGIIRRIEEEYITERKYGNQMIDALVSQLFIGIYRGSHREETMFDRPGYQEFRDLRRKIRHEPSLPWTVEEMASQVQVSPSHFHVMYRNFFGCTPIQDLIHIRIEQAKIQLQYGEEPLGVIAEGVGYRNHYHFSRQFRQETGMSPSEYRKMMK